MRRFAFLILPIGLVLAQAASAQHWNETGPGRDLLTSTVTDFETFRQRAPSQPSFQPAAPAAAARQPIPMLDWVPPPPVPAAPTASTRRRSSPPRRIVRRPVERPVDPDPLPIARPLTPAPAPVAPVAANQDWERTLSERERELERLRRTLEEDRLRYQQSRQPTLR